MIGAGQGLCITPLTVTVLTSLDPHTAGAAAGLLSTMQQVGNALGVAITGVIFFGALHGGFAHALTLSLAEFAALLIAVAGPLAAAASPQARVMNDLDKLVDRYVQMWNETDGDQRHQRVRELFAETAIRYSPMAMQQGHEAITQAVTTSYERFVAQGFRFRAIGNALAHHDAIRFSWEMITADQTVDSVGTTIPLLDDARQIRLDYQFTETPPPPETLAS